MLFVLCLAAFFVQMGYLGWVMWHTPHAPQHGTPPSDAASSALPPCTVVVALHNERDVLPDVAEALHRQTHPDVHVVWVNDHSTDGTADWLNAHTADDSSAHVVHHTGPQGKKHALDTGIAAAPTELLAFTDADCTPPLTWLATLAQHHTATDTPTVLIGPSLPATPRTLLERVAAYETWTATIPMLAAAQAGRPYMAVGRNLSYPKAAYKQTEGHTAHAHLLSGDDDLFVQAAHRAGIPCQAVWTAAAEVPTTAPASWGTWLRQQQRHTSSGRVYDRSPAVHLSGYYAAAAVLWLPPLLIGTVGAGLLALRLIMLSTLVQRADALFAPRAPMLAFPLWDALHTFIRIGTATAGLLRPPTRW